MDRPQKNLPAASGHPLRPFPWLLVVGLVAGVFLIIVAYFLFTRPKAVPSQILFERLFPAGSVIRELEKIELDIDDVMQDRVFRSLREHGPVPIQIPPLGKSNPFL